MNEGVIMTGSRTDYREHLLERLRDKEEAAAYLNAVLEYADVPVLMLAIRDVVDAYGVRYVAESAGLNRESLYRMLSEQGNPRLSSLFAILKTVGLRLAVEIDQESVSATGDETSGGVTFQDINYQSAGTSLAGWVNDSSIETYVSEGERIEPRWLRLDEKTNALDYLQKAGESIQKVDNNPEEWKWVILGLHGALCGFAVCACMGTNSAGVKIKTKKRGEKLISFHEALRRCQDENLMKMTISSKHLELTSEQSDSIIMLKEAFRNEFEHFQPKAWSIEIHGFPQMAMNVLDVIRFLALDTGNYVHLSTSQRRKLISVVHQSKKTLKQSQLYGEYQEVLKHAGSKEE